MRQFKPIQYNYRRPNGAAATRTSTPDLKEYLRRRNAEDRQLRPDRTDARMRRRGLG